MLTPIKSRSSSKLGHVGSKTRSQGQIIENIVYTLEGTVLILSSCNVVRMSILIISKSSSKLGHAGTKNSP